MQLHSGYAPETAMKPPPLQAGSQEEAEWLIRHKYPSQAELEHLRSESLDVLQLKASAGDTTAAAVLGKRPALEGIRRRPST
jgi:hypothetical protein